MTSKADVERWRALAEAATPGPWYVKSYTESADIVTGTSNIGEFVLDEDADCAAASRAAVPAMAEMLARAAALLAEWDEAESYVEDGGAKCWGRTVEWLAEWAATDE